MNTPISPHTTKLHVHPFTVTLSGQLAPRKKVQKLSAVSFSGMTHEIRNPLTNISLAVEILSHMDIDDAQRAYLDIILRGSVQINGLLTELMKYQQVEKVKAERHSVHQLLDEVLKMAADRISLKNIVLRKEYTAHDCETNLTRPEMKIALTNIIINAVDAMTTGKGELTIITKKMNGKFVLEIEDNGCGISNENLKHIFTPYFTNKPGGLGLGLATTYDILRANHIKVNVESVQGTGTRFILVFDKGSSF